jgi:CheY-like chemotaxis protein
MSNRVLVIEDEPELLEIIVEILLNHHIKAVKAKNGLEAIQILAVDTDFSLILTDWHMPVMDGEKFLQEYSRLIRKKIPILIVSSCATAQKRGHPFLPKPFSSIELLRKIEKLGGFGAG